MKPIAVRGAELAAGARLRDAVLDEDDVAADGEVSLSAMSLLRAYASVTASPACSARIATAPALAADQRERVRGQPPAPAVAGLIEATLPSVTITSATSVEPWTPRAREYVPHSGV